MRLPKKWTLVVAAVLALVLLAWLVGRARGPVLPGYEVTAGPLVQNVVGTGRVLSPSRVQVRAEISGLVLERRVMDGDRVEAGDLLVVLRAEDLEARRDEARAALAALRQAELPDAQARLRQAQADLAQAQRSHARRRELAARQLVARESVEGAAQAEIAARAAAEQGRLAVDALAGGARQAQLEERLQAAEAELERAQVRASVPGVVLSRHVEPGDTVVPGDLMLEIAADAPGEILVPLDEKNLARLDTGQQAVCIADAFPDRAFGATVHHIAPGIDPGRGTIDVRLRVDPEVDFLRQDLTVQGAVALSGAAFASSMARAGRWYEALLAVSGARLGAWLPNPAFLSRARDAARGGDWAYPWLPRTRGLSYLLRQDLTVTATIQTGRRDRALVVPNDALLDSRRGSHEAQVLVLRGGRLQRVPVTLGLRGLAMSEVVEGLEEGEHVVAAGALDAAAMPEPGSRARIRGEPLPDAGADRATRGEMPVQLD